MRRQRISRRRLPSEPMTKILLSAIVAVSNNRVIGRDNALPWRLSNDLKWFKKTTMGKPMIMGRKTFDSLPGLLPGRPHIVITRDAGFTAEDAIVTRSLDEAIARGREEARQLNVTEVIIIGGAEIYRQSLPLLDRLYLTEVHAELPGDAFFPELVAADWVETFREDHEKSERDEFAHSFVILEARRAR